MSCIDKEMYQKRLDALKAAIDNAYDIRLAATLNPHKSYKLNTGQNDISVTNSDLSSINMYIRRLESQYDELYAQINGCASSFYMRSRR